MGGGLTFDLSRSVAAADSRAIAASEAVTLGASARRASARSPAKARYLGYAAKERVKTRSGVFLAWF